ncbi:MAG: cation transporter [Ruminococcus sp.]|nr:cation transporter [Ruminococcus sp.]
MIRFIIRRFIRDSENVADQRVRAQYGTLAGTLGVICNVFLFAVKLTIGLLMNSIAIISDAVNNLSDTGSSIVTIIGTKLANRHADKEHPFGHGRMEYVSALIVSFLIVIVGFELLRTSVGQIVHPEPVALKLPLVIILVLSMLIKAWMFAYNRYMGRKINSAVLIAAASDSLNDVLATAAVIVSAIVSKFVSFPIDAIAGGIVSLLIMYTGYGVAKSTVDLLLGSAPDAELVRKIEETVLCADSIVGIHDLVVHDYGPGRIMASCHAEVPDDANIVHIHEVIDATEEKITSELGIVMVIHMDPVTVNNEKVDRLKAMVISAVRSVDENYSIHDFRITDGEKHMNILFDLEIPCEVPAAVRAQKIEAIRGGIMSCQSGCNVVIKVDDKF